MTSNFFFLKKTVILKSLGNEKKLNNSNNIIEISFGQMSNFNHKNFFLIIKSFFYFIFYNKNVKIYPEFKFKENLNLKKKLQKFLLKFNIDALSILEKDFVNFFHDNVIYQNAIISFLNKRFNNFKVNYFFSDHVTWLDSFCIAKYSKTKKIKSYLCSHGMIDYNHKYNKFIKSELNSLSKGLCSSYYITSVITQTPTAYKYARNKNENVENIIKAHPFAYNGQRKKKVTVNQKKINILFAGTYKVFLSRPYIYQGSFEFISSIKKIVKIFSSYSNVNLIFNIRKNDEIENLLYRELFGNFKNINFYFNKNIEILMQDCDLLITNFSTLVDEFAYLRKPIIIFNEFMKYECYKKIYKNNNKKKNKLLPIYYYNEKQLKNNIREILVMIRRGFKTSLPLHIWDNTKAIDNQNLLKKINVFK